MLKKWIFGVGLLLIATCVAAAVHLSNQENIACMVIRQGEQEIAVSFEDLNRGTFSGELIDGKGDVTFHEYTGVLLRELLEDKRIDLGELSCLTVTSADNYSVGFAPEEILQTDTVYAAITADGAAIAGIDPGTDGVQIIVFADPNSRRCVRFAQQITIE